MDKITICLIVCLSAVFHAAFAFAGEKDDFPVEITPGMEVIRVGNADIVVPKGSQVFDNKGFISVESISQYTGRRMFELEERLSGIDDRQSEFEKDAAALRKQLEKTDLTHKEFEKADLAAHKKSAANQEGLRNTCSGLLEEQKRLKELTDALKEEQTTLKESLAALSDEQDWIKTSISKLKDLLGYKEIDENTAVIMEIRKD